MLCGYICNENAFLICFFHKHLLNCTALEKVISVAGSVQNNMRKTCYYGPLLPGKLYRQVSI